MAKQTFTTGQVLTAAQVNALQTNDFNQTVSAKTASYVLVAADKGTRIEFSTSGSVTCTVNTGLFDAGDTVYIQNTGAGVVTITAGTATVNTSASLTVNQYEGGVLYFVSASSAIWFEFASTATGDITGITTGASSGLTGGVTSGTADLKVNFASKGQLAVGTGSGTTGFLNVGTNGYTIVADSAETTGIKWAAPAGGGKVLQVVQATYSTSTAINTATDTDTGLSASITPSASTSKILVLVSQKYKVNNASDRAHSTHRLLRGSTVIVETGGGANTGYDGYSFLSASSGGNPTTIWGRSDFMYLDSPATTSSTTYKTQAGSQASGTVTYQDNSNLSSMILLEIGA